MEPSDRDADVLAEPDRLQDHVLARRRARLLRRQHPLVDEQLHQALVAGDLAEPAIAQQVRARVADLGDVGLVTAHEQRRQRRGHPPAILAACRLEDLLVRAQDGGLELLVDRTLGRRAAGERGVERLEHQRARDLTGLRPTHAVRQGEQHAALEDVDRLLGAALLDLLPGREIADGERVFIIEARPPHIGHRGHVHLHAWHESSPRSHRSRVQA